MGTESNRSHAERNFVLQQGLDAPPPEACPRRFSALMFQPRIVGTVALVAILLQSPVIFMALSAVLWWSALFPRWNPFEALYNRTLAARPGAIPLSAAPGPRRFAQGMAATFTLAIGVALLSHWNVAAYILEALMAGALAALIFGRFCLGSFLYFLFRGRAEFALRTLPWARGE